MPIYEYRCESCNKELEKIQKFSDPPLTDCPACGKAALKKLVSASSFRLKGTGWYETDFKDKSSKIKPESSASSELKKADESKSANDSNAGKNEAVKKSDSESGSGKPTGKEAGKASGNAPGKAGKESS